MTDIKTDNGLLSTTVTYWPIFFLPEYRNYYKLEQLWNDAKLAEIPDVE